MFHIQYSHLLFSINNDSYFAHVGTQKSTSLLQILTSIHYMGRPTVIYT